MGKKNQKSGKVFSDVEIRYYFMELILFLLAAIIVLRLFYIQLWERSKYQTMAKKQYIIEIPLDASRGLIYDRNMNYLALNEPSVSIGLDKRQMAGTSGQYARALAPVLGISETWIRNRIRSVSGHFVWLRRRIDLEKGPKVAALNLPGIRVEKDTRRVYPHQEIASHVIGFTNADNEGISGSELQFDKILSGRKGRVIIQRDGRGQAVPENVVERVDPIDGKSIVLTIDYILQTIAAEELRRAVREYNAKNGTVIICNPMTGEILAIANEPTYNPNSPARYSLEDRRNRAITDGFEPGSTFKIVTFAAIFDNHLKQVNDLVFAENGTYLLNGRRLRDSEAHGWLTVADVLAYSSNIGTIKLARELGDQALYDSARRFGFGDKSEIPLPGETPGILRNPLKWTSFSQASLAIGQEIACNAIQLAMAYSAIANGGMLLRPKIVHGVLDARGKMHEYKIREPVRRVISEKTASIMVSLLKKVVDRGTGKTAKVEGLSIAGKTGTAQKPRKNGRGYSDSEYVASFVGFFPAERPKYLILVKLDTDRAHQWGNKSAAPTFKRIAQKIRIYDRDIKPAQPDTLRKKGIWKPEQLTYEMNGVVLPDLTNRKLSLAEEVLKAMDLKIHPEGKGDFVLNQKPQPGTLVQRGQEITLQLFEVKTADGYIRMPSVMGLSLREALNRLALANLDPIVYGHGVVKRQKPAPGSLVKSGIRSVIECESIMANVPILSRVVYDE